MATKLRVLIVEDSEDDAELVVRELQRAGYDLEWHRVDSEAAYLGSLKAGNLDVVLSDYSLPQFDGLRALTLLKERDPDVPFILVSASIGEETAVAMMKHGAADYLLKDRMARLGPAVQRALAEGRMLADSRAAGRALAIAESRYRSIFENAVEGMYQRTPDGRYLTANPAFARMLGYDSPDDLLAMDTEALNQVWHDPAERDRFERTLRIRGVVTGFEMLLRRRDDTLIWVSANVRIITDEQGAERYEGTAEDVTERKRAEEALRASEEQLRQSQKMEAVGRLAGGVAHDFNNLLTVIGVNAEATLALTVEGDSRRDRVGDIREAARRAAELTSQLLAFSRKQVLAPQVINLNTVVGDTQRMLERVIGEDIKIVAGLDPRLGNTIADPGQIAQVLMNLAVNSRDAMMNSGTLTIETRNVHVVGEHAGNGPPLAPGSYVCLIVTDTGSGMDEETRQRVFEPFFTTKDAGKGTGLGLATVHGIVLQSGGAIWVTSEPGHGTSFTIHLPTASADVTPARAQVSAGPAAVTGSGETILVTEDENTLRNAVARILSAAGYTVLSAASGVEALQANERHPGPIHMLMTDVVMPGMSGRELAGKMVAIRPDLKVLFTSGYTEDTSDHHGAIPSSHYLAKPYHVAELTRKVREILDATL